jgi:hypothetical protein
MAPATPAQAAQMEAKVALVRAALEAAEQASDKAMAGQNIGGAILSAISPIGFLGSLGWNAAPAVLTSNGSEAVAGSIRRARERFEKWADKEGLNGWRYWALRGTEPDGQGGYRNYPVSFWLGIGDALLSELGSAKKEAQVATTAAAARQATEATTRAVGSAATKVADVVGDAAGALTKPWPTSWKVAAGVVGLAAVLGLGGYALSQVNTLTGRKAG